MCAAADPAADDVVALGDKVARTAEAEIGESLAKGGDELPDVLATAPRLMQRVLQQHVGCRKVVDHLGIPGIAPELREPAANDRLVLLFLGHDAYLSRCCRLASRCRPAECSRLSDCRRQLRVYALAW